MLRVETYRSATPIPRKNMKKAREDNGAIAQNKRSLRFTTKGQVFMNANGRELKLPSAGDSRPMSTLARPNAPGALCMMIARNMPMEELALPETALAPMARPSQAQWISKPMSGNSLSGWLDCAGATAGAG